MLKHNNIQKSNKDRVCKMPLVWCKFLYRLKLCDTNNAFPVTLVAGLSNRFKGMVLNQVSDLRTM